MKTKHRTKAHQRRFQQLQELGCVCCRQAGCGYVPPDIHHILDGGRRKSHDDTIPLCPYHHRGIQSEFGVYPGPSLADGKKPFEAEWGTQKELLRKVNQYLKGNPLEFDE